MKILRQVLNNALADPQQMKKISPVVRWTNRSCR